MTILSTDIAILAAERLNDDTDGGGQATNRVVQDNVENNLFPDISSIDRAQGAMNFRKIFPAVLSTNTDVYYGAHVIIDEAPADPEVSALLVGGTSQAETRSQRITTLNTATFYGIKKLRADVAINGQVLNVGSLTSRLIPATRVSAPDSGVAAQSAGASGYAPRSAYFAGDSFPLALSASTQGAVAQASATFPPMPGSLVGATVTDSGGTFNIVNSTDASGLPTARINDTFGVPVTFRDVGVVISRINGTPFAATAVSGTYTRCLSQSLPVTVERVTFTSAMGVVFNFTLASFSEIGSEWVEWTDASGTVNRLFNAGLTTFAKFGGTGSPTATIDRSTRALTAVLDPAPKVGTDIVVSYVKAGYIQAIASPGSFSGGTATMTEAANYTFSKAFFRANSTDYFLDGSTVYRWLAPTIGQPARAGAVVGSYTKATRVIAIPELPAGTVAISNWVGIQTSDLFPVGDVVGWTMPTNLDVTSLTISGRKSSDGSVWSAASDATGAFSTALVTGNYDPGSGQLNLTFTEAVSSTIQYSGSRFTYSPVPKVVTGVDPAVYPVNGEVVAFRVNDVVVVHNTQTTAPQTVTASTTIATRANIDEARVIGADGAEIFTGFTVNKATGNVTFSNVTGYSQPVKVKHRQEDMATIVAATAGGQITLSKKLKHAYPAANSYVSSAYVIGDLQAKARNGFQQSSWLGNWLDVPEGAGVLADFNETAYPIVCTNKGAKKERWALIFTSSTAFRIVGEEVGEIGTGSTSAPCSPQNPITGSPYFTIDPLAWGAGWAVGNVYRFNTDGALWPAWLIRSVNPSDPFVGVDKITAAVRGDINA